MKLVEDFFNKSAKDIDQKYFPDLKYYRDDKNSANVHYALECFSNGVFGYDNLLSKLAKSCKDTRESIHLILSKHVKKFGDYIFK